MGRAIREAWSRPSSPYPNFGMWIGASQSITSGMWPSLVERGGYICGYGDDGLDHVFLVIVNILNFWKLTLSFFLSFYMCLVLLISLTFVVLFALQINVIPSLLTANPIITVEAVCCMNYCNLVEVARMFDWTESFSLLFQKGHLVKEVPCVMRLVDLCRLCINS